MSRKYVIINADEVSSVDFSQVDETSADTVRYNVAGTKTFVKFDADTTPSFLDGLAGEALKNKDALIEAEETIEALSHGDVSKLVAQGMMEHKTGFDAFTSYIKKILIGAAILLGGYLAIPIFIAKRTAQNCSKSEAEKHMTRAPFPVKPPSQNT